VSAPGHDPAWARLLAAARRSLERTGGALDTTISLTAPDEAERLLVIGITGVHRPAGVGRLTVQLSELDEALHQSQGYGLVEVLGGTLRDRPAERDAAARARAAVIRQAQTSEHQAADWFQRWLADLLRDGTVTRLARTGRDLSAAVRVLDALPAADEPMPVLGERLLGDTKALTEPTLRTLLLRAVARWQNAEVPSNAEEERELWESVGVVPDDLASQVLVLNIRASGGPVSDWLTDAARIGCPMRITLHQLRLAPLEVADEEIFVVENPAVLRAASVAYGPDAPAMICTEGVASAAAHRLFGQCRKATVWWRNDFDWAGVRMTAAALARYANARPWRMGTADYLAASVTGQPLIGNPTATPWEPQLADELIATGRSVMEERLLPLLLEDLRR
jgi:uncharacterized protein (TIGR02679 family)